MDAHIIAQQIEELRHKQHIESISLLKHNHYQIVYCPKLTNSPYSHLVYYLKLLLPERYPQVPPKLIFLDKIYHLNIETTSGMLHMPLLSDDWSPYLTLVAVFDSLDNILEEPDLAYAASASLKEEYTNQPEKYIEKVEQFIRAANEVREEMGQSVIEHVEVINDSKVNNGNYQNSSIPDFFANDVEHNLQNSQALSDIPKVKLNTISSQYQKVDKIRVQTQSEITPQEIAKNQTVYKPVLLIPNKIQQFAQSRASKTVKESAKNTKEVRQSENIQKLSRQILILKQSNDEALLKSQGQFADMQLNLRQADGLLNILITESNNMDECIRKSQNTRVKSLLQAKLERIIWMLEQTLELSSQLRDKMFEYVKQTSKSLLK